MLQRPKFDTHIYHNQLDSEHHQFTISSPAYFHKTERSASLAVAMDNITGIDPNSAPKADARTEQNFPLPHGWEQGTTPEGRVYYLNHNTHITTWNDPRNPNPNPENESVPASLHGPPLPAGWEAQHQPDGTVYFTDHNTKSTTFEDPRRQSPVNNIVPASVDSTLLPTGWEEKRTLKGQVYFVDHNTKSTVWNDPRQSTSSPSTVA
jgi:hypothetical protein